MNIKKSIITTILAAALIVSLAGVSAAEQTWYLSSSTDSDSGNCVMYEDQTGGNANVQVGPGESVIWIANESAGPGAKFAEGGWSGQLTKAGPSKAFEVAIGVWDGTSFASEGSVTGEFGSSVCSFTILNVNTFIVPDGSYLAFNVTNTETEMNFNIVTWNSERPSYVSPPTGSSYPTPELSTILLMSVGLLALVGCVEFGRRKQK